MGFSLIESLIAVLILSGGVVLYARNWTDHFAAKSAIHQRSMAATQAAEIGNALLANVADIDKGAPRGEVVSRVQQFSNELTREVNRLAESSGYECNNNKPVLKEKSLDKADLAESTLPRTWAQGASVCISIKPMPDETSKPNDPNGVWVLIEAHWIDPHTRDKQVETVSVHTLVSPL